MRDPNDELASDLVLALRRAVAAGVTVTREHGGYRVLSADGALSVIVADDGSTSELMSHETDAADGSPTEMRAAFWDPALLRSRDARGAANRAPDRRIVPARPRDGGARPPATDW